MQEWGSSVWLSNAGLHKWFWSEDVLFLDSLWSGSDVCRTSNWILTPAASYFLQALNEIQDSVDLCPFLNCQNSENPCWTINEYYQKVTSHCDILLKKTKQTQNMAI